MLRTPHTTVYKGKRVRVVLRNGTTFVDKFVERTSKYVKMEQHPHLEPHDIRSFTINKNKTIQH